MPQKHINTGSASKIRKSIPKRTAKQKAVRQRRTAETGAAPIIADSIYSVKFKVKKGVEVFSKYGRNNDDDIDIEAMCNDIYAIYKHLSKVQANNETANLTDSGLERKLYLYYLLKQIKKLIPSYMDINIEKTEEGRYYVMAYCHCDFMCFWHTLAIKEIVLKLKRENKALHDLFLSFIHSFSSSTTGIGICMWYDGYMADHYESMMYEQYINYMEERDLEDPEDAAFLDGYQADIQEYKKGLPVKYKKLIRASKLMTGTELMKRAIRFKPGNPIANLIYQGAQLMIGFDFSDFTYYPYGDIEDNYYLSLDQQLNIVWSDKDNLYSEYDQTLEAMSHEGIQETYLSLPLTTDTKKIDFELLERGRKWPLQVSQYFQRSTELIKNFLDK